MSEVKTSVFSKPSAFLEELPLGEKQYTKNVISLKLQLLGL